MRVKTSLVTTMLGLFALSVGSVYWSVAQQPAPGAREGAEKRPDSVVSSLREKPVA